MILFRFLAIFPLVFVALPCLAQCDAGLKALKEQRDRAPPKTATFLTAFFEAKPPCGSFAAVARRLAGEEKKGGFKLEDPRALDVKQANENLALAMQSPDVRSRFDEMHQRVADADLRLALEAAILDDERFYGARDLKIAQLKERLK